MTYITESQSAIATAIRANKLTEGDITLHLGSHSQWLDLNSNCSQTAQTTSKISELNCWQQEQVNEVVPEPIVITIAQRRAQYHYKDRLRWIDAKRMALSATGCVDTAEVKKWLKVLGVRHLSLRMTSAWVAVRCDLAIKIKTVRNKKCSSESKVIDLTGYKLGARSAKDCATNWEIMPQDRKQECQNNIDVVFNAMKEAIATSNWDVLRLALIEREQYKVAAWAMLSTIQKQQISELVPPELRLLKLAKKQGAIAAFKECEEGGIFWVWRTLDTDPNFLSGTAVANFLRDVPLRISQAVPTS